MQELVKIPKEAVGVEGSSVYLTESEELTIEELLYGLMLRSGNDCATALALYNAETVENFASKMNKKAKEIGAFDTNFTNPSGLPNDNHYTTAQDLAKISVYAMKNETFKKIVSTKIYRGPHKTFLNKNKSLQKIDGANGVKTGYTIKAGRCLVSSAFKNGMQLICVVLNCPDMYERSKLLIENTFSNYEIKHLGQDNIFTCDNVLCKIANNCNILIKKNTNVKYIIKKCNNEVNKLNNPRGILEIYEQNNLIFCENLYTI